MNIFQSLLQAINRLDTVRFGWHCGNMKPRPRYNCLRISLFVSPDQDMPVPAEQIYISSIMGSQTTNQALFFFIKQNWEALKGAHSFI